MLGLYRQTVILLLHFAKAIILGIIFTALLTLPLLRSHKAPNKIHLLGLKVRFSGGAVALGSTPALPSKKAFTQVFLKRPYFGPSRTEGKILSGSH